MLVAASQPMIRSFLTQTVLPAACLVGAAYNLALMVNGPEGRRADDLIRARIDAERAALADLRAQTAHLEDRADRLLMANLDEDLFEERLRARLGLTAPGEYMIRTDELDRLASLEAHSDRRDHRPRRDG